MTWNTPMTAVANAPLTAAQWNASVRDNLLETVPAKATQSGSYFAGTGANSIAERVPVISSDPSTDTTTSTSYTDLAGTSGPGVTVTSGTKALILLNAALSNNTNGATSYVAYDTSGATTQGPLDNVAIRLTTAAANQAIAASLAILAPLTAGSNTFTLKYRVTSGTGSYSFRRITAMPF